MLKKLPLITLVILGFVVAVRFVPGSFDLLVYHRLLILRGEWWRMLTGHLVHGSTEHVIRDGASFVFFGSILEHRLGKIYLPYFLGSAIALSFGYLIFSPTVMRYCGLSGVITGMCGTLLVQELPRTWKGKHWFLFVFYGLITTGLFGKVGYEFISGHSFFYRVEDMKAAPEAHVMGLSIGVAALVLQRLLQKEYSLPPVPMASICVALAGGGTWLGMILFW